MEIIKKYWGLLLLGFILRLVIAGFTFHPDVTTPALASAVVFKDGTLNFYGNSSKYAPREVLDDLPLSYLISLPLHAIARPFVLDEVEKTFFSDRSLLFGQPIFWIYLIYAKLPFIIFDLALGILLALILPSHQKKIFTVWMFNPITLWATAAIGQADIYPTFFIVLAFFLLKKNQINWASFSLGAGGAIKSTPFLLVPLLLAFAKDTKERIMILIFAVIPYIVTVIPYLPIKEFKQNALFAPQLSKMLYAQIPLSGEESLFLVPTILTFLYLLYFSKKRETNEFLSFSITVLLTVLVFTHFHMQWFLWVLPFLFIWLLENWQGSVQFATTLFFLSWFLMLFLFESSLQLKLFAPIFPSLDQVNGLKELLSVNQAAFLRNIAATIFAASSGFIIWKLKIN